MTIQEITQSIGSWNLAFRDEVPPKIWDRCAYWGHIVIVRGRFSPELYGDGLLANGVAAYVGPVRERDSGDSFRLAGPGLAAWLGDEDGKGAVYETAVDLAAVTFPNAIRALLPASGAVTEGTLYAVPGTYTGRHQFEDPRSAVTYVCQTMSTDANPVSWRVNPNGTLDAGRDVDLFVTTPKCIIVRKGAGEDLTLKARTGSLEVASDLEDFTTRVVLLAEGEGASIATGSADIAPGLNPYKDLHGNTVDMTRLVSESDTSTTNADVRAQLQLNRFSGTRNALTLTADDYDVQGDYRVGDYVWVYDPDSGLVDTAQETTFRGRRINPVKLKVTEVDWPVTSGHTVAYRSGAGVWTDLTDYVAWENPGGVKITVGDFNRALTQAGTEPVGSRPAVDTSVPDTPVFVEPFYGSSYLDGKGFTRARVIVSWNAPNNTDGSTVLDGDHYELRYAVDTDSVYPATWSAVSAIRWRDMQTWAQPFAAPAGGQWQIAYVNWSDTSTVLQDLSPGVGYDVQIRAVDTTGNLGEWSGTTTFVATEDNLPPSTPAIPEVAASRIAAQITHRLGKASGGLFNLESDLDHLEIHASGDALFTPTLGTLLGKLKANAGMIQGQVAAVGSYQVESTAALWYKVVAVDIAGNRSGSSAGAQQTALLMDDAHISDLTVSKVMAGTVTSSWVMAGEIKTGDTGARMRISADGYELFNAAGVRTMYGATADGSLTMIGELRSSLTNGSALVANPAGSTTPEIRFYSPDGTTYGKMYGIDEVGTAGADTSVKIRSNTVAGSLSALGATSDHSFLGRYELDGSNNLIAKGGRISTDGSVGLMEYQSGGVTGGQASAGSSYAKIGYSPGTVSENTFYASAGGLLFFGSISGAGASNAAIAPGISSTQTGLSFITNYGPTFPGSNVPTLMTLSSSSSPGASWISARSSSNFTVTRATATSCQATYWGFNQ